MRSCASMRPFMKPLTARECADYMRFTTEWIRRAITEGVTVRGVPILLDAETLSLNGRRTYRIHLDKFSEFLQALGWKHLPARTEAPVRPHALPRASNA